MYNAFINGTEIIIEDRDGNVIAVKPFPRTKAFATREWLMSKPENAMAYELVKKMVEAANGR